MPKKQIRHDPRFVCHPRDAATTTLSNLRTLKMDRLYGKDCITTDEEGQLVNPNDLKRVHFNYGGAFPFMMDAIAYIGACTELQKKLTFKPISDIYYMVRISFKDLNHAATGCSSLVQSFFLKEVWRLTKEPPLLFVTNGKGQSSLIKPFDIVTIKHSDASTGKNNPSPDEGKRSIPIYKRETVDLLVYRPFLDAALNIDGHHGFIKMSPHFYTKIFQTLETLENDPIRSKKYKKFKNLCSPDIHPITLYKFFMYLQVQKPDENNKLHVPLFELLSCISPSDLNYDSQGNPRMKNKRTATLLLDKLCFLVNTMAEYHYLEPSDVVSESCSLDTYSMICTIVLKKGYHPLPQPQHYQQERLF